MHIGTVASYRCDRINDLINLYRVKDLSLSHRLCTIAYRRTQTQWQAQRMWHDLNPIIKTLEDWGGCWLNVGEVISSNRHSTLNPTAFISSWKSSVSHWTILMAQRYDKGAGYYRGGNNFNISTYYVLDLC